MNKNFTRVLCFSLATLFTCSCSDEGKIDPIQMPDANGSASLPKCEGNQLYDTQLQRCVEPPKPKCTNGKLYDPENDECIVPPKPKCTDGKLYDPEHDVCVNPAVYSSCKDGQEYDAQNDRCITPGECPLNQHFDDVLGSCIDVCDCGYTYDKNDRTCVMIPEIDELDTYQKVQLALKETAMAYYRKGHNLQYETYMRGQYAPPENATSQHLDYLVCSAFVYAVYYQALGIDLLPVTGEYQKYASDYMDQDGHSDIIFYKGQLESRLSSKNYREEVRKEIFENRKLQEGDVVTIQLDDNGGHTMIVYDLFTDADNKPNAHILHSGIHASNYIVEREAITKMKYSRRTHWDSNPNPETGVEEGTVQFSNLWDEDKEQVGAQPFNKVAQITVLRPAINANLQKKYNQIDTVNLTNDDRYTVTPKDYEIKEPSWCRIQYHNIDIEKTVNIHDGSTVEPGGQMVYNITITNDGDQPYKDVYIKEYISKFVDVTDSNKGFLYPTVDLHTDNTDEFDHTLAWFIPEIKPGKLNAIKLEYTVKVKDDPDVLGKTIHSSGLVAKIPSAPIENVVAWSLNEDEISKLKSIFALDENGIDLYTIEHAYNSIGYELNLKELNLGELYFDKERKGAFNNANETSIFFEKYGRLIPYLNRSTNPNPQSTGSLLYAYYYENISHSDAHEALQLNKEHELANIVLNHYYGGVLARYSKSQDETDAFYNHSESTYDKKLDFAYRFERSIFEDWYNKPNSRTDRANIVYPDTLRDGDILIYANTLDQVYMKNTCNNGNCADLVPGIVKVSDEDGVYAYLFLDGKFIGSNCINHDDSITDCDIQSFVIKDGKIPEATQSFIDNGSRIGLKDMFNRFGDIPRLYGKDFYVILRPALQKTKK